ncbi:MAG: hypothetical protein WD114_03285 [Phycisphaerales bacterium]
MLADNAGRYSHDDTVFKIARDVLRAAGYFSYQQIRQKLAKRHEGRPDDLEHKFEYITIKFAEDYASIIRIEVSGLHDSHPHRFMRSLARLEQEHMNTASVSYTQQPSEADGDFVWQLLAEGENVWDPNPYWVCARFEKGRMKSLQFAASEDGQASFEDLDKD